MAKTTGGGLSRESTDRVYYRHQMGFRSSYFSRGLNRWVVTSFEYRRRNILGETQKYRCSDELSFTLVQLEEFVIQHLKIFSKQLDV